MTQATQPLDKEDWAFLDENFDKPGNTTERDYKTRISSDIYRAMQTRLDGYRQAATAIFLGTIAGLLTLDSAIFSAIGKIFIGIDHVTPEAHFYSGLFVFFSGIAIVIGGCAIVGTLGHIDSYFEEMTSIVYKFDLANKVFTKGVWLRNDQLYPERFRTKRVICKDEEYLTTWRDPSIRLLTDIIWHATVVNALVFVFCGILMTNLFGLL